jgi:hypothetical protein
MPAAPANLAISMRAIVAHASRTAEVFASAGEESRAADGYLAAS